MTKRTRARGKKRPLVKWGGEATTAAPTTTIAPVVATTETVLNRNPYTDIGYLVPDSRDSTPVLNYLQQYYIQSKSYLVPGSRNTNSLGGHQ